MPLLITLRKNLGLSNAYTIDPYAAAALTFHNVVHDIYRLIRKNMEQNDLS